MAKRLTEIDPWLAPYEGHMIRRRSLLNDTLDVIENRYGTLKDFADRHLFYGLHKTDDQWVFREWAPNASAVYLVGAFSGWQPQQEFKLQKSSGGNWEIALPDSILKHGDHYKLWIEWDGAGAMRLPAYATRIVQDSETLLFSAQVWQPESFIWTDQDFRVADEPVLIYEAHTGMAQEEPKVGSYIEFADKILPRINAAGYNTLQLMAVQEHPYYGSFGYHVSNFFAPSGRFGTPEDLKFLINSAHNLGISVIMDIVHSHSVRNEEEGLSRFDGSYDQYFHSGDRGNHPAWDSRCFDYGKEEVQRFLLSNCRYWIEEFHFDGFRFDGVTSMLYTHHGLEKAFTSYDDYFDGSLDDDAVLYLTLANKLIHEIHPKAISVAEEMSGLPGITAATNEDGLGFDYRLSMGVPDFWIKLIKEKADEEWQVGTLFHELTQHRPEEKVISYAESHDQALVGDKTIIFRLADKEMYDHMAIDHPSLVVDRAIALHKMIRLLTLSTAYGGYLNFMGNEFGHPEWIDFPREGNNWSYHYARRQWSLFDNEKLKFRWLGMFDKAMIDLARKHSLNGIPEIYLKMDNETDQVLAFERGSLLFVFNFNPSVSYTDYGIPVYPGKFRIVLSADNPEYGGFDRVDERTIHFSQPVPLNKSHHQVKLYIPARTAFVLERQKVRSVYDV
ncbi:alpha amylase C-terminal domain-containing protein [Natronoflexus pectinivorans]|uniref:1,4-alpha-glucan branching enzyme n=1 Tax=Natronoflexus pectinivorans TaxID=682526 RepID=A0A4R2GI49_9BACT|nr:alpha amylase C-terminal domain-containing protein [Natronoflexus pectinivorans]TCO07953.1 1,4-alpha-glucan branching enzyme [Natronoflexus pectinivorans]